MATESRFPNVLVTQTNLSGSVTDIDDDPDSPDGAWLSPTSNSANTVCEVSFPDTSGSLTTGAGLQEFRIRYGTYGNGDSPDALTIQLYEGGTLRATLLSETNTSRTPQSSGGEVISVTWDASVLSTQAANADVRLRITTTADTSPTPQISTGGIGAIEWVVAYSAAIPDLQAATGSYAVSGNAANLIGEFLLEAAVGSYAITGNPAETVKGFSLQLETGSYALSGQAADTLIERNLDAATGSYSISGQPAAFGRDYIIGLESGSYQVSGQDTATNYGIQEGQFDPEFVGVGSAAGGVGSVSPTLPSGIQNGDLLILHIEAECEDGNADSGPSGWTFIGTVGSNATGNPETTRHTLYYLWYDGSTPDLTVPDAGDHTLAIISAWRNVNRITGPWDASPVSRNDLTADTTLQTLGITTTTNGALVVFSFSTGDDNTFSNRFQSSNLSGQSVAAEVSTTEGSDGTIGITYGRMVTAGSANDYICTINEAEEGAYWTLALRPAVRWILPGVVGSYAITGEPLRFARGYSLQCASGSYSLSGQPAAIARSIELNAETGSYSLSGQPAALQVSRVLQAATGSYSISGQPAEANRGFALAAETGSYSIAGQAAALQRGLIAQLDSGAYTITGQPTEFVNGFAVQLDTGSYALAGQPLAFSQEWVLQAETGAYTITGSPADLQASTEQPTMPALTGSYEITGQDAALRRGYVMQMATGSYSVSGQDAAYQRDLVLGCEAGGYSVTGIPASFNFGDVLEAETGSYAVAGQSVAFKRGYVLGLDSGNYAVNGQDVAYASSVTLQLETGSYSINGFPVGLGGERVLALETGSYLVTGEKAALFDQDQFAANSGAYQLAGYPCALGYNRPRSRRVVIVG